MQRVSCRLHAAAMLRQQLSCQVLSRPCVAIRMASSNATAKTALASAECSSLEIPSLPDMISKRVERLLRPTPDTNRLFQLLARVSHVDAQTSVQIKQQLAALNINVRPDLHLLVLSNIAEAGHDAAFSQYFDSLTHAQQLAILEEASAFAVCAPSSSPHVSTSFKFRQERERTIALTPDTLATASPPPRAPHLSPPSSRSRSRSIGSRRLFDLTESHGWTASGQQLELSLDEVLCFGSAAAKHLTSSTSVDGVGHALLSESHTVASDVINRLLPLVVKAPANIAVPQVVRLLTHIVEHDMLLTNTTLKDIFAIPGLHDSPLLTSSFVAFVSHAAHIGDAAITPTEVDAIIAAAADTNVTEEDFFTLDPVLKLVLPPGGSLIEYIERLEMAALSAGAERPTDHIRRVALLLADHAAMREDLGSLRHAVGFVSRLAPEQRTCRVQTQLRIIAALEGVGVKEVDKVKDIWRGTPPPPVALELVDIFARHGASTCAQELVERVVAAGLKEWTVEEQSQLLSAAVLAHKSCSNPHDKIEYYQQHRNKFASGVTLLPEAATFLIESIFQLAARPSADSNLNRLLASVLESMQPEEESIKASLPLLNVVLQHASINKKNASENLPLVKTIVAQAHKLLSSALVVDREDVPVVLDTITHLIAWRIKDGESSEQADMVAAIKDVLQFTSRLPNIDIAFEVKHTALGRVVGVFAGERCPKRCVRLLKLMPELDVEYRHVANAALEAAAREPRKEAVSQLHDALEQSGIRVPIDVHIKLLQHIAASKQIKPVVKAFLRMSDSGMHVPKEAYVILTNVFASVGNFGAAMKVLDQMQAKNTTPTIGVYNSIIRAASHPEHLNDIAHLLKGLNGKVKPDIATHVLLARKHLRFKQREKAANIIHDMVAKGLPLSASAAEVWLEAVSHRKDDVIHQIKTITSAVKELRLSMSPRYYNTILSVCVRMLGSLKEIAQEKVAAPLFDEFPPAAQDVLELAQRTYDDFKKSGQTMNLPLANKMLAAVAFKGELELINSILYDMRAGLVKPNAETYVHLVDACGQADALDAMQQAFEEYMQSTQTLTNIDVITKAIYHYGRHRQIDKAMEVYDVMNEHELVPTPELNRILVEVCGIDKTEVLLNAAKAEERMRARDSMKKR